MKGIKVLNKKEWNSLRKVLNAIKNYRYKEYKVKISNTIHNYHTKVAITIYNKENKIIREYLVTNIALKINEKDGLEQIKYHKEIDIDYSEDINFIFYSLLNNEQYKLYISKDTNGIKLLK